MKCVNKLAVPLIRNLVILLAVVLPAAAAMARPITEIKVGDKEPNTWLGYALIVLLAMAVLTINLLPSKRSHQD